MFCKELHVARFSLGYIFDVIIKRLALLTVYRSFTSQHGTLVFTKCLAILANEAYCLEHML